MTGEVAGHSENERRTIAALLRMHVPIARSAGTPRIAWLGDRRLGEAVRDAAMVPSAEWWFGEPDRATNRMPQPPGRIADVVVLHRLLGEPLPLAPSRLSYALRTLADPDGSSRAILVEPVARGLVEVVQQPIMPAVQGADRGLAMARRLELVAGAPAMREPDLRALVGMYGWSFADTDPHRIGGPHPSLIAMLRPQTARG